MEKVLKPFDKEFMRMAMLKHEETFREQVYELHRLYKTQKMLMKSTMLNNHQKTQGDQRDLSARMMMMNNGSDNQRLQVHRNTDDQVGLRVADHAEHIAESNNNNNNNNAMAMAMEDGEIELTLSLGPSTYNPRRHRAMDKSESGQSVSSSSTGSSQTRKTSPKTCSSTRDFTWGNSNNNNSNNTFAHQGPESDPGFSNGQQNNPPWMFQALSLKLS